MELDMEEFRLIMKQRFLEGFDTDFADYKSIDVDASFDDMKEINR